MTRVVIYPNGVRECPLLLTSVERIGGVVVRGYVENGDWYYRRRGAEHQALYGSRGGSIMNRWPVAAPTKDIHVPDDVRGDYNAVIAWANQQP